MKIHVAMIALAIMLVFFSGCLSGPALYDRTQGDLHTHYEYSEDRNDPGFPVHLCRSFGYRRDPEL